MAKRWLPMAKLYMCWRWRSRPRCCRCCCYRPRHMPCAPKKRGVFGQDVGSVPRARVVPVVVVHQRGLRRRRRRRRMRMVVGHGVARHPLAVWVGHQWGWRLQRWRSARSTRRDSVGSGRRQRLRRIGFVVSQSPKPALRMVMRQRRRLLIMVFGRRVHAWVRVVTGGRVRGGRLWRQIPTVVVRVMLAVVIVA